MKREKRQSGNRTQWGYRFLQIFSSKLLFTKKIFLSLMPQYYAPNAVYSWQMHGRVFSSLLLNLGDVGSGWHRASSQKDSLVFPLNRVLITEEHNLISTYTMDRSHSSQKWMEGKGVLQTYHSIFGLSEFILKWVQQNAICISFSYVIPYVCVHI